eukprot:CAMPEP_0172312682 /NCGR_PEP_ID=MMETSP1058-20130122/18341_1 /TAXON_ID=83371 /ORGANISM="Detonula confervacea, Strain CCMP 353" /LENGTH=144 /DNA_ID=CAMNT_0013026215 /DNA_START=80 /DNA_END=514 /DNA_ORIENTATION=+
MTTPFTPAAEATANPRESLTQEQSTLLNTIHLLLGSKLHVTMTDGRVARGNFVCLDRLGNMILEDVVECRQVAYTIPPELSSSDDKGNTNEEGNGELQCNKQTMYKWDTERSLSQAVIPGDRLAKVDIAKGEWETRVGSDTPKM